MQFLQKHYSNITRCVLFGLLTLVTFSSVIAQKPNLPTIPVTCDYPTAPAIVTLVAGAEPIGFSKTYLLVDMVSGAITARSTVSPIFTGVGQGIYYAVTAYYTSGASIHNDVVGKLISDVYVNGLVGGCLKYSSPVGIKVCTATCDYSAAPATIAFTATPSPTPGVTTTYALVNDATNKILQTSTSASFSSVPVGEYSIVGVYSTGTFTLAVGDTLYAKTTNDVNCVGVSNTIHYKVCSSACVAGTTAPAITPTTVDNVCPLTTFSLASLTNTGATPSGTSLIWSLSRIPTSVADTLADIATVGVAGKYYALYYDKVNNCYSPADSVVATLNTCGIPLCNLTLPLLLPLGSVKLLPNLCTKGEFNYYKEGIADLVSYIAISPNGSSFSPTSVTVDASQIGVYTRTNLINTTAVANRMAMVVAPGNYNINGGVKVRIYYNPIEFLTLPTQYRTWFKHPAHVKSTVLGDLTVTGLSNAIALTPDSSGIENGIAFVQFNNITSFSTFGYMGSTVAGCVAGSTAPAINETTVTNTCPSTTFSLAGLTNIGTKPAGTSLVWSTHREPTSSGDTLTNLTAVSTAGTYYALYYDKVIDCYSPADSVTATIVDCNDIDGDGVANINDLDDDNDGILDTAECPNISKVQYVDFAGWPALQSVHSVPYPSGGTVKVNTVLSYTRNGTAMTYQHSNGDLGAGVRFPRAFEGGSLAGNFTGTVFGNEYTGVITPTNSSALNLLRSASPQQIGDYLHKVEIDYTNTSQGSTDESAIIAVGGFYPDVQGWNNEIIIQAYLPGNVLETNYTDWKVLLSDVNTSQAGGGTFSTPWQTGTKTATGIVLDPSDNPAGYSGSQDARWAQVQAPAGKAYEKVIITRHLIATTGGYDFEYWALALGYEYKSADCDTDGDGLSNVVDLDSDNDGCPDAIEGGG
ncbi:MAG: hypothetical protein QE277_05880, partial [Flectobacillus sp.]|nr:hypothetical protein [Flectobacillus sp.]